MKELTAEKFDEAIGQDAPRIIWTAKAIGKKIGRSERWVRGVLVKLDGSPVHRALGGNFYAAEDDLMRFLQDQAR